MQMIVEKLTAEAFDVRVRIHYDEVRLSKRDTVRDSFRLVMSSIIEHMRSNVPEALAGEAEGVHQLRIGIRRARSALRFYKPLLPANKVRRFDTRLRRFGLIFGPARDWDVFLTETYKVTWPEADEIHQRALRQHRDHQGQVTGVLRQPQFAKLLDRLNNWSHSVPLPEEPFGKHAPDLLDRLVRQTRKRQRAAAKDDPKSMHRLRRSVKRLRYACEFVGWMYPRKQVKRYTKMLKQSQDLLGKFNDTIVTEGLLTYIEMQAPMRTLLAEQQAATRARAKGPTGLKAKQFW